jgi:hypothetical protein
VHAEPGAAVHQRVRDVVPVTEVDQPPTGQRTANLGERHVVGQTLARVKVVGQPVDHRDLGETGQLLDQLVAEGATHRAVDPALEVARHVLDALAHADLAVARRVVDGVTAELRHPGLEGHAGAQRRLLEVHEQRAPGERRCIVLGIRLDLVGQLQRAAELLRVEVE